MLAALLGGAFGDVGVEGGICSRRGGEEKKCCEMDNEWWFFTGDDAEERRCVELARSKCSTLDALLYLTVPRSTEWPAAF